MAKDNIYDKIISELILRIADGTTNVPAQLVLVSNLLSNSVAVGFSGNVIFTSTVFGLPSGYSVSGITHTINYPGGVPASTTSSNVQVSGPSVPVSLGTLGSTFTVTSSVTITNGVDPDIVLSDSYIITAVAPAYYGVQAYSLTPTTPGLSSMASTTNSFQMTTSGVGRLVIALPVGSASLVSITDSSGLFYPISDFSTITNGGYVFYQLNYDTQLTGSYIKTFTINYL